jgi:hypothetical protein
MGKWYQVLLTMLWIKKKEYKRKNLWSNIVSLWNIQIKYSKHVVSSVIRSDNQ